MLGYSISCDSNKGYWGFASFCVDKVVYWEECNQEGASPKPGFRRCHLSVYFLSDKSPGSLSACFPYLEIVADNRTFSTGFKESDTFALWHGTN